MNDARTMSTTEIYAVLRGLNCGAGRANALVEMFHKAGIFLAERIENHGWKWRANYMREHAGCAFGAKFTNTMSPYINELVFRKFPDLRKYDAPISDAPLFPGV